MPDVLPFAKTVDVDAILKRAAEHIWSVPDKLPDLVAALTADVVTLGNQNVILIEDVRALADMLATLLGGGYPNASARKIALRRAIEIADKTSRAPTSGPQKSR